MAYEGGGKIKNKRGSDASKPYARNPSLMGRMKESVKEMLSPSWLVHLVSSVKNRSPSSSPTPQSDQQQRVDGGSENHMNSMSAASTSTPLQHHTQQQRFQTLQQTPSITTTAAEHQQFPVDPMPSFQQFNNKFSSLSHPLLNGGENNTDLGEFSSSCAPSTSLSMGQQLEKKSNDYRDNKIAQMRKEYAGSITPSKELDAQTSRGQEQGEESKKSNANSFLWTTEVKQKDASKPQPTPKSKQPSFNVSVFGSSFQSPERSIFGSPSTSIHESSYYEGKTTFGGAASARRNRSRCSSPYQSPCIIRRQVTVKPLKSSDSAVTSSTAKQILDVLERMNTPLNDAKKIPSYASNVVDSPLTFSPVSYRRRNVPARALGVDIGSPPVRGVQTPRAARIAENLHRPALHSIPKPTLPPKSSQEKPAEESQKTSEIVVGGGGGRPGKMKRDRGGGHYSRGAPQQEEEIVTAPDLPTEFTLPVTDFTGFSLPVVSPVQGKPPSHDASSPMSGGFKFSSPISKAEPTSKKEQETVMTEFKFSSPLSMAGSSSTQTRTTSMGSFAFGSSSTSTSLKMKPAATSIQSTVKFDAPSELKSGSVMDALSKPLSLPKPVATQPSTGVASELKQGSCLSVLSGGEKKNTDSTPPPLSALFKKAAGSWECSMCMIQNKPEVSKCVACETPKPGQAPPAPVIEPPKLAEGVKPLSELFKKPAGQWECSLCMIQNKADVSKCIACETPKPGAAPGKPSAAMASSAASTLSSSLQPNTMKTPTSTQPSLAEMFKKPEGSWECDTCMVSNKAAANKCIACETPKPGAPKPTSNFTSPGGFKFGPSGGFQFSTPSNNNNKDKDNSEEKPISNGGFQLPGLTKMQDLKDSKNESAISTGGFKFGTSTNDSKTEDSSKAASSSGGFKLSSLKSNTSSTSTSGFGEVKFSSTTTDSKNKDTPASITFGSVPQNSTEQKEKIKDSVSTDKTDKASNSKPTAAFGGFSFGSNASSSTVTNTTLSSDNGKSSSSTATTTLATPAPVSSLFQFGKPVSSNTAPSDTNKPLGVASSTPFQFTAPTPAAKVDSASAGDGTKPTNTATTSSVTPLFGTAAFNSTKSDESKPAPAFGAPAAGGFTFGAAANSTSGSGANSSLFGGSKSSVPVAPAAASAAAASTPATPFAFTAAGQKHGLDDSTSSTVGGKRTRDGVSATSTSASGSGNNVFSNGGGSTFGTGAAFGSAAAGNGSAPGFTFGAAANSSSAAGKTAQMNNTPFGSSGSASSSTPLFGAPAAQSTSSTGVFQFSSPSPSTGAKPPAAPFTFGQANNNAAATNATPSSEPFNFSAKSSTANFNFGGPTAFSGGTPAPPKPNNQTFLAAPGADTSNPFNVVAGAAPKRREIKKAVRKIRK